MAWYGSIKNICRTVFRKPLTSYVNSGPNIPSKTWSPICTIFKQHVPKWTRNRLSYNMNCVPKSLPNGQASSGTRSRVHPGFFFIFSFSFPFFQTEESKKEDEIVTTLKLAVLAHQRGETAKSEQLLHLALKIAQEANDQNAITYIYDLMANFALEKEEYKKAETLFVDVLKRFLGAGMETDDNAVVDVSLKLASIYCHLGDMEKACEGFQFCVETQEAKLRERGELNVDEDTFALWGMSHDWFARFLLHAGHYDRAKTHFLRAHEVCVKVKGEEDPQTAVLLSDLGSVCSLQQNFDEAIQYLNKAILVAKGCASEDLASFYVNLGTVYLQKKVFEEAERFCKEGGVVAKQSKNDEAYQESLLCLETLKEVKNL